MKPDKKKKVEKCKKCKKEIKPGVPTGTLRIIEKLKPKGKRIVRSSKVCIDCSGEELLKTEQSGRKGK